jgi:hypothetical protein
MQKTHQHQNRERALDRRDGLRIPKHQPVKRSDSKRDLKQAMQQSNKEE